MIVIQRLRTVWNKASRGADRGRHQRPALPDALALPGEPVGWGIHIHQYELSVFKRFRPEEDFGTRDALMATRRYASDFPAPLIWRHTDIFEFGLAHPSPSRLQTHWPEVTFPLGILRPGDVQCIDWNGRFRFSLSGANRSSHYVQERIWLADVETAPRDLFLTATPRKHIDLRRHIY